MDERTHFYSVVASALQASNETQQKKIQSIFERDYAQNADEIVREIGTIIGADKLMYILTSLDNVSQEMQRMNEKVRYN